MHNTSKRFITAAAAGMLALGTGLPQVPVHAGVPSPHQGMADSRRTVTPDPNSSDAIDAVTLATMRWQETLQPAIVALAALQSGPGFAGLSIEGNVISVYYKGRIPPALEPAVRLARQTASVEIRSARFSAADLRSQADQIWRAAQPDSDIQTITINGDGSGLTIEKLPSDRTERREKAGASIKPTERIVASVNVASPVTITTAAAPVELTACSGPCSRIDDESPWNSGTFIHNPRANYRCSTGFAVHNPFPQTGYKILTAAHCGSAGDYYEDFTGEYVGSVGLDDWSHDVGTINAQGWYWMWDGSSTTTWHKTVRSWWYPTNGELVCQSGYHGTVCNLKTQSGDTWVVRACPDSDGDCYNMFDFKKVIKQDAGDVAKSGDSGGPVFTLDGSGVRAKGLVSARSKTSTSSPYYNVMYYQDMVNIYDVHGLEPRVG
jgi:hypothetical protein